MKISIEIPSLEDLKKVNELAVQVHEMHVSWTPDLYRSVEEVISKEYFEILVKKPHSLSNASSSSI